MSLITISKSIGCGSGTIAEIVASKLKLELYDRQRFQQEAARMGISSEELECLSEKIPSISERLIGNKPQLYNDLMGRVTYELARRNQGIFLNCASHLYLRQFSSVLSVLLCASECCRKAHLMDWHGLTEAEAEKMIGRCDRERKAFLRFMGQKDQDIPTNFDIVIDTERIDMEAAVDLILRIASSDKFKQCNEQELETIERLALKRRIRAVLSKSNLKRCILQLDVPEKGVANIRGWISTQGAYERIVNILNDTPGIASVDVNIAIGAWSPKVLVQRRQITRIK
jgi:cytidylate kinase